MKTDIGNRKVILCVDDETTGLSVRKMLLESRGYRVITAESGSKALDLFACEAVDLVVLDYLMPGTHGWGVAKEMKRLKPTIPIVMLSAYVDLPSETLVMIDKSVTKGEPPIVLLDVIQGLLGQNRDAQSKSVA